MASIKRVKKVVEDRPGDEAKRVYKSIGKPDVIRGESGTSQVTGPFALTEDGAVAVPLQTTLSDGMFTLSNDFAKIMRGYDPDTLERFLLGRQFFPHIQERVWRRDLWDTVFSGLPDDGMVLDVGSGVGDHFHVLDGEEKERIVAFDYMKQFLDRVRADHPEVVTERGDWTETGFSDGAFVGITGFNAISATHSRGELHKTLVEFDRILGPCPDGVKRMHFMTNMDPLPEDWYPGDYDTDCLPLMQYDPMSNEYFMARSPLCQAARGKFLTTSKAILTDLGYDVDITSRIGEDREVDVFPVDLATEKQREVISKNADARMFVHTPAIGVLFCLDVDLPRDKIKEGIEYYTITARKNV